MARSERGADGPKIVTLLLALAVFLPAPALRYLNSCPLDFCFRLAHHFPFSALRISFRIVTHPYSQSTDTGFIALTHSHFYP